MISAQRAEQLEDRRTLRDDDGTITAVDGLFVVKTAFQPIFRSQAGRIVPIAFEALARPFRNGTPVVPGHYFANLTGDNLVETEALLRHVHVQNAKTLPRQAKRLFINFHPAALSNQSTFEATLDALGEDVRQAGIAPPDLICEFTEQREQSEEALKHFVYALRARGYLIAVDDFGAAFSDPVRIARLTPDIIKIDGAMVRRQLASEDGFDELKRLVEMFRRDGIRCVLEGLENTRQVELARRTGAALLQGFALGGPQLAPGHFDHIMAAYRDEPETPLVKALR